MSTVSEVNTRQTNCWKKVSGLVAVLLTSTSIATAADMRFPDPLPPIPVLPQAPTWTGMYVGIQGGYVFGKNTTHEYFTANMASTGLEWTYDVKGWLGGGHAGYNYQAGNVVFGIEGDIEYANLRGRFFDPPVPPLNPGGRGLIHVDWQGSLRGRLGYAFNNLMFYGTGGIAFAHINHTYINQTTFVAENTDRIRTGWTVGVGLEYALSASISARAEYRYTDFGNYFYDSTTAFPGLTGEERPHFHSTRLGVSYRF